MMGGYIEMAYNILINLNKGDKALIFFSRLETYNLNHTPADGAQKMEYRRQS
jgi:hypothetical protein